MRIAIASLLLVLSAALCEAAEVPITSDIRAVTVFLRGAEVTRVAKVKLDKGEHVLVLADVPASAVPGSIRVEGKASGKMTIGSVDTAHKLLQRAESAAADVDRKKIEDEMERLRDERAVIEAEKQAADTQSTLVSNLAQLPLRPSSATTPPAGDDWPRVLAVIAQGAHDASRAALEAGKKLRDYDRRLDDLARRLAGLAPPRTEQTEVRVNVDAAAPLEADLFIRYQIAKASWSPIYDARLTTGSKTEPPKIELARRAAITQRSGEAWTDVTLKLSTARPSESASLPDIDTQIVNFEPEVQPMTASPPPMARMEKRAAPEDQATRGDGASDTDTSVAEAAPVPEAPVKETTAAIATAPFEATFEVVGKVTVAANGEAKRVVLQTDQVEPELSARTVPKAEPNAYLYAGLTLPKGTPLLPGQVYLFRDGTFVGTSHLPLLQPGETHQLGFGVDDLVKIRHTVLEEKRGASGLISTSNVDSRNYRVTAKNLHDRAIKICVIDRVPVSRNEQIRVEYTGPDEPTAHDFEHKRGVVAYEAKLEPDQEKVLEYGYKISWPAAKSIVYGP